VTVGTGMFSITSINWANFSLSVWMIVVVPKD
jgi:hypothetical protein